METYKVELFCTNCGFEGYVEIEKGKVIEERECPNCGNRTLNRPVKFLSSEPL
jgi:predicted RNA-binding Zn-ribbon protein involved in translation (DUF1610 family)